MHTVSKDFAFEAAHHLNPELLGATHKCCRPHGHSYRVRVYCSALQLDARGFVIDYAEISAAVDPLIARLDHQNLNDILPFHTTADLGCVVEQFFSPQTYRRPQHPDRHFAIDNGAFGQFDSALFLRLVKRELPRRHLCRFVTAVDVVGCAERTAMLFEIWREKLAGWPIAYVAQDGQEKFSPPWDDFSALFLGGTTAWKVSEHAAELAREAKRRRKWVHAGRVNSPDRFIHFEPLADSCDGTGLARYTHMREAIPYTKSQPTLAL